MKCHQCERPALYLVGEENNVPLCLECYSKFSHIQNMAFLQNATMMNRALDDLDMVAGFTSNSARIPVLALSQAMKRNVVLNNINISQSQIGVLNTGTIQRIDAAITLSKGSDAEEIGLMIKELTELVMLSNDVSDLQKVEIIDLTETLAEEMVGKRKPATITAVMRSITEKVQGVAALAGAADKLWQTIRPFLPA